MVPRSSDRITRVPPYLICPVKLRIRDCHPYRWPFQTILLVLPGSAGPRSLATTNGVSIDFLSSGYLDVSVPRVCSKPPMYSGVKYLVSPTVDHLTEHSPNRPRVGAERALRSNNNKASGGFPHSDIHGSKPIPGSPWLNAGYHVLHRLLLPRHPPNALFALDLIQKEQNLSFDKLNHPVSKAVTFPCIASGLRHHAVRLVY